MVRRRLAAMVFVAAMSWAAAVSAQTTTVIIVRHAERADQSTDSPLSDIGRNKANELAESLRNAGITSVYSSQFARTQQTAEPLAKALGITTTVVPVTGSATVYAQNLAKRILEEAKGRTVLVVGHSNTVPEVVSALGAPPVPALSESDYGDLFIVTVGADGRAGVIRARQR